MAQPRTVLNILLHEKKRKISGGFYHKMQVDFAYNSIFHSPNTQNLSYVLTKYNSTFCLRIIHISLI